MLSACLAASLGLEAWADPFPPPMSVAELSNKIDAYNTALADWQSTSTPQGMEPVFAKGQEAAFGMLGSDENLSDADFESLGKKLQGYLAHREEITVVAPDPVWFESQAKAHGTPADMAFFNLMGQTLNGYWPATMERVSDLTGCTRYGSHELVRLYGAWQDFLRQYPGAYDKEVHDPNLLLLADVEDQLENGLAACEGPDSVTDEFETFIKTYPDSPLSAKLKKRIELVKQGKSDMIFYQGVKYNGAQ